LKLPGFLHSRHMKVTRLSTLNCQPPIPPRRYPWYSFVLEAESNTRATLRPERIEPATSGL
jgi:hypothetical protein